MNDENGESMEPVDEVPSGFAATVSIIPHASVRPIMWKYDVIHKTGNT